MVSSITSRECRQLWFGSSRSVIGCEIRSASSTYSGTYNDNVRWRSACVSVHFPFNVSSDRPARRIAVMDGWHEVFECFIDRVTQVIPGFAANNWRCVTIAISANIALVDHGVVDPCH